MRHTHTATATAQKMNGKSNKLDLLEAFDWLMAILLLSFATSWYVNQCDAAEDIDAHQETIHPRSSNMSSRQPRLRLMTNENAEIRICFCFRIDDAATRGITMHHWRYAKEIMCSFIRIVPYILIFLLRLLSSAPSCTSSCCRCEWIKIAYIIHFSFSSFRFLFRFHLHSFAYKSQDLVLACHLDGVRVAGASERASLLEHSPSECARNKNSKTKLWFTKLRMQYHYGH